MVKEKFDWQKLTGNLDLELSVNLNREFDVELLLRDTRAVIENCCPVLQHGEYHDGGWKGVTLHGSNGDYSETRLLRNTCFAKTEALSHAPYIESIIDSFDCVKRRIRLMALDPGKNIAWHFDRTDSLDSESLRLHIPIATSPLVQFQISHEACFWKAGQLWYGDFSFPHRLHNGWDKPRIHLILDLEPSEHILGLFPKKYLEERHQRDLVRRIVHRSFTFWENRKA